MRLEFRYGQLWSVSPGCNLPPFERCFQNNKKGEAGCRPLYLIIIITQLFLGHVIFSCQERSVLIIQPVRLSVCCDSCRWEKSCGESDVGPFCSRLSCEALQWENTKGSCWTLRCRTDYWEQPGSAAPPPHPNLHLDSIFMHISLVHTFQNVLFIVRKMHNVWIHVK